MPLLLLLFCSSFAFADDGVEVRKVRHAGEAWTVATVDLNEAQLGLFGQAAPFPKTFDDLEQHLQAQDRELVLAMNGGMYNHGYTPTGLHVERGKAYGKLVVGEGGGNFHLLPNGVFVLTSEGARVIETLQYDVPVEEVVAATQSGPMLLIDGEIHPAFRENSANKLPRNGICASDPRTVHLVISEGSVRFWDFATLMRDELGCRDALFLDGVVSAMRHKSRKSADHGHFGSILAVTRPVEH